VPAASAFAATYLDPTAGTLVGKQPNVRFRVANAVYDLTKLLNEGTSAANAQASVLLKRRHTKSLYDAASLLDANTIITDFRAITTP
jgi:hypothetical protein